MELHRSENGNSNPTPSAFEGRIIDSIEIDNRNIYDLEDSRYKGFLFRTANHLHIVTRRRIVEQELLLAVGDAFSAELAEETARNLRTRFPFNDAWMEIKELASGQVLLRVVTVDQWSLIGGLRSINRDGNETNFQVGFEERNLFGRAQFLSFDFFVREAEPNYISMTYREPRVLGRRWAIGLNYRSDPTNNLKRVQISRPYYALAQKYAFDLQISKEALHREQFDTQGDSVSQWTTAGDNMELSAGYRMGPSYRKVSLFGEYKYLFKQIQDTVVFAGMESIAPPFPVDSVYHRFSLGASYTLQTFIVEKRIRGFGYTEDVTLGLGMNIAYGRAFQPGLRGYHYDLATGSVSWAIKQGSHLISAEYSRFHWFKGTTGIRRLSSLGIRLYNNHWREVTFALRSLYQSDQFKDHLNLVLGGKSGLRGYAREFAAGDRSHVLNLETRFFLGLELLSVKIGSALFVDLGQAWHGNDPYSIKGYHFSGGGGLRLSLENLLRGEIIRIDGVLVEGGEWELSFGTGQYF
jgi:hypothetical protein